NNCGFGMIGFVKQENFEHWKDKINGWIGNLSKKDTFWDIDEMLKVDKFSTHYFFLHSVAHRKLSDDISIYHFWIETK
ncbi:MAG: hypothetical protein U9Q83_01855, partial [Bacteroidota bacterium]|nr:hypothetical protein [Bacteroidota bacterium]